MIREKLATVAFVLAGIAQGAPFQAPQPAPQTKAEKKAGNLPVGKRGPGMVWVDPATKTYYRPDHPLYGKTKKGTYMSEGDAVNGGFHDSTERAPKTSSNR
jgi:hypothetical protein